jgi:hypothetical protein
MKDSTGSPKWLLLIHQIPPKPDYFRVKVRRRLQRIGAVALKNSVYVLPSRAETAEDFRWLLREIVSEGGEATLCEASLVEGVTEAEMAALFMSDRDAEYAEVVAAARQVTSAGQPGESGHLNAESEVGRLRARLDEIESIDYFESPGRRAAERALTQLENRVSHQGTNEAGVQKGAEKMQGRTWVTRKDVHVDRIASAWLIRRFIDPKARFKFTGVDTYRPRPGELRFDMFEAEYSHEGERCTFETLLKQVGLRDRGLRAIGEIVHDIDCKDDKFGRVEAAGIAAIIRGLVRAYPDDATRLERGAAAFDDLYASLS